MNSWIRHIYRIICFGCTNTQTKRSHKIWQNHGMLIWHAHDAHLVLVCKQLLADFAGSILEMYSLKVSANCQRRCYRCAEMRLALWGKIQVEISSHAGVTVVMTMWAYDLNWKVFKGSIWIQKKYTWRELPVFFVVSTHNAVSVTCKIIAYCRKTVIIVFCLCLSLFPPLSRTPSCISIIPVNFWEGVVFTRHLPQI